MKSWQAERGYRPLSETGAGRDILVGPPSGPDAGVVVDFGRPENDEVFLDVCGGMAVIAYDRDERWGLSINLPRSGEPTVTVRTPDDPTPRDLPLAVAVALLRAAAPAPAPAPAN